MKNAFSYSDYTRSKTNWNLNENYASKINVNHSVTI